MAENDEIPQAPVDDVYQALARFFGRVAAADGLQNAGEQTVAKIDAISQLQEELEWRDERRWGATIVQLGER